MSDKVTDERDIDFIEILWQIFEQWRGLLLVVLTCAMLLPLLMGVKNVSHSGGVASVSQRETDIKYQGALNTVSAYMRMKTLANAYDKSVLNLDDFSNGLVVTSTYELIADDIQKIAALASAYDGVFYNMNFTASIASFYSAEATSNSVYDACFIITGNVPSPFYGVNMGAVLPLPDHLDRNTLFVKAYLPKGVKAEDWSRRLTEVLQNYSAELTNSFGPQSIKLISVNAAETPLADIAGLQNRRIASINSAKQSYDDMYKKLPGDTRKLVNAVIDALDSKDLEVYNLAAVRAELDKRFAATAQPKARAKVGILSGFTPKWIGLGFGLGVVLYVGVLFMQMVLSRKVVYAGEIESSLGVRNFGSVYEYPYQSKWQRFLHDERIYNRRYKSTPVEKIGADLATKLEFEKTETISLLTLGQGSQRSKEITSQQAEILKQKKIGCEVIEVKAPVSDMSDADFAGKKKVFLQILKGETTYDMLSDLCSKLEEYKVEIVGMEFIEVA